MSTGASHSSEQQAAEVVIREATAALLGTALEPRSYKLPGGSRVDVDGASPDDSVLVEIYARQGALKGANFHKVARDALKLITLARAVGTTPRLVIAFADEAAASCVKTRSWLSEALATWSVEVHVVDIGTDLRDGLKAAQLRQLMVNPVQA